MTKRFKNVIEGNFALFYDGDEHIPFDEVAGVLNSLNDENEQLKKQNDFLTTQLAELSTYMMALGYDIELEFEDGRVIKLNEELKGDVE